LAGLRVWQSAEKPPCPDATFSDQLPRCIVESHRDGVDARHPEGVALQSESDTESGQACRRYRNAYLMHDQMNRVTGRRVAIVVDTRWR
jgi:hypothetical protein